MKRRIKVHYPVRWRLGWPTVDVVCHATRQDVILRVPRVLAGSDHPALAEIYTRAIRDEAAK